MLLALSACSKPQQAREVRPAVIADVPQVLRGTIGAEATIKGTQPTLIAGLGVVVGLNGTGGGEYDQAIVTTMEREMARGGIGKGGPDGELQGITPAQFLRDPNVAIVLVEAAIPPGTPEGTDFDVRVRTLPGSSVSSLEGGTLWTTDLRLGPAAAFGSYRTRKVGEARGPIFINPFVEPAAMVEGHVTVSRTTGRILGGGKMTEPLKLALVMDNESHARARSMVSAVNARFPQGPGDDGPTARGRDGSSIAIQVPNVYRNDPMEFIQLLRFTRVDQSYPQEYARVYAEQLKAQSGLSSEISWCLQATGKTAIPFLAPLYDYPELAPRMAALEAGAKLGDPRTISRLIELAQGGPPNLRARAIELLARMPSNPAINFALGDLVNSPDLTMRIAAYEGLAARGDARIGRTVVSGSGIEGSESLDPKFIIETVPSYEPLVYVTQQGQPRIVIFAGLSKAEPGGTPASGCGVRLNKPLLVTMWSDRLMLSCDSPTEDVRLQFRDRSGRMGQFKAPEDLAELMEFLAHRRTPEEDSLGLNLTFSEVVGAVYEISRQGGINAVFATERDKLRAEIIEAAQQTVLSDRPETEGQASELDDIFKPRAEAEPAPEQGGGTVDRKSKIIPLHHPKKEQKN